MDSSSRYQNVGTAVHRTADGTDIVYRARRIVPQGADMPIQQTTVVAAADRLDLVAARTLGNPLQFWRIADANNAMDPSALTAVPGRRLRVPLPQPASS